MKTYSEVNKKKKFDWFEALSKWPISVEEADRLSDLSQKWVTCACGNQCSIIPRDSEGMPVDPKLLQLGTKFHELGVSSMWEVLSDKNPLVNFNNLANLRRKYALKVLKQIEKRSDVLIRQEVLKAKKIVNEFRGLSRKSNKK